MTTTDARILRNEDIIIDILHGKEGDTAVFRHLKIDLHYECPLKEMMQGRLRFVREVFKKITMDPDEAVKVSKQAADVVGLARSLDVSGLVEWVASHEQDKIMVAIFELLRRGEPLPAAVLYSNSFAMSSPVIRTYLLEESHQFSDAP